MKIYKNKEGRIKLYRELVKKERDSKYIKGICVVLGDLCGGYTLVPWLGWTNLMKYFPELSVYKQPILGASFTTYTRKKVIESLASRINKKKDIYRNSNIFKKV